MPKRIQRKRSKGWRMPEGAVYVGRPSKWGNPFTLHDGTREQVVEMFRNLIEGNIWSEPNVLSIRMELQGKDLVCWCKPDEPCHADVLLEIANAPSAKEGERE